MIDRGYIVLARLDSHRLPNKAFKKFGDKKLIDWSIDSLMQDNSAKVILATTNRPVDDLLEKYALEKGIYCYRGDEKNVAKRLLDTIKIYKIKYFARINADSPFIRIDLLQEGFDKIKTGLYDFVTNLVERTFPYGISVEIFSSSFFIKEYSNFNDPEHFEHVTKYFYEHSDSFNIFSIKYHENSHHIRLVVDTVEDLKYFNKLYLQHENLNLKKIEELINIFRK